jgi:hypothetical protein
MQPCQQILGVSRRLKIRLPKCGAVFSYTHAHRTVEQETSLALVACSLLLVAVVVVVDAGVDEGEEEEEEEEEKKACQGCKSPKARNHFHASQWKRPKHWCNSCKNGSPYAYMYINAANFMR